MNYSMRKKKEAKELFSEAKKTEMDKTRVGEVTKLLIFYRLKEQKIFT